LCEEELATYARAIFLSFTKSAAQEATSRLKVGGRINASTIHSLCYSHLGISRSQVIESFKLQDFSKIVGVDIATPHDDGPQVGDDYLSVISYARNKEMDMMQAYDEFGRPGSPTMFFQFQEAYAKWKKTFGFVDYNDMLADFVKDETYYHAPPVVAIDEAQDCSNLQWRVIKKIAATAERVFIGGDDDQAIYEWSGAEPHAMIDYADDSGGEVVVLNKSWRLPWAVHRFAVESILSQFERRVPKLFDHRDAQGKLDVYGTVEAQIDTEPFQTDVMYLVRDRYRSLEVQKQLNAELIPYRILGGYSPFDNTKAHAIRAVTKLNAGELLTSDETRALAVTTNQGVDYSHVLGKHWTEVVPMSAVNREFYDSADLMAPIRVTLATIHQAKGRECEKVVVDLTLTDRVIENALRNKDAELRVMYVACTRAKEELNLCGENLLI
jgi:superfamily I DNA/RNA helicase